MKHSFLLTGLVLSFSVSVAQTNTFPSSGNVGIGTLSPLDALHVNGIIRWGGYNNKFFYSGEDNTGGYFEQVADHADQSKMRFQVSKLGDGANYSQLIIDPEKGFSFLNTGSGNSNVGIGTNDTKGYKLAVAGSMIAESVKVKLQSSWPDYVFAKDYTLPTLQQTENHIKEKGHLPGIPSAAEVKANGVDLGEMNAKLLQKIEELTLYLIEMKKDNDLQRKTNETQNDKINKLEEIIRTKLR